jgi:uncharacterized protein YjiS (DUF1127 family)
MTRCLASPKGRIAGPYELFAAGRAVWAFVKNVALRMKNRRAVVQLLDWDEHALRDIGLTCADVHLSLALPLSEDPSTRLAAWSMERRAARLLRHRDYDGPVAAPQLRLVSERSRSTSASISRP